MIEIVLAADRSGTEYEHREPLDLGSYRALVVQAVVSTARDRLEAALSDREHFQCYIVDACAAEVDASCPARGWWAPALLPTRSRSPPVAPQICIAATTT